AAVREMPADFQPTFVERGGDLLVEMPSGRETLCFSLGRASLARPCEREAARFFAWQALELHRFGPPSQHAYTLE
ncbi:MAG: hypothetical protein ACREQ5_09220, partial [Candidatus Dormibacteria bacterium]